MTKSQKAISLRAFGYNSKHDKNNRRESLVKAIAKYDKYKVFERLKFVSEMSESRNYEYYPNMKDDLQWIKNTMNLDFIDIDLSLFEYDTNLPIKKRKIAILKAIKSHGYEKILNKMNNILAESDDYEKKDIYEIDNEWISKLEPLTLECLDLLDDPKALNMIELLSILQS